MAKRVIVFEDSYRNELERKVVSLGDQIGNWEFYRHQYLKAEEWKKIMKKNHWRLVHFEEFSEVNFGILYSHYCAFVIG